MQKISALLATSACWLGLAACATGAPPASIADTAARMPQLSTWHKLTGEAGLTETLRAGGPYTVFAPTDEAFKAVPPKTLERLSQDKEQLKAVLMHHVVPGKTLTGDLKPGKAKTAEGGELTVAGTAGFVTVEEALVTQADLPAANGVVHVIDRVLLPPKR